MTFCRPQKVKISSDGHTEIITKNVEMRLGMAQKAPRGAPRVPSMQNDAPREGSGTPVARLFHEINALRGADRPTPGTGRSQKHPKIMTKIDPETDVEKVLQKLCKTTRNYLQNRYQKRWEIRAIPEPSKSCFFCEGYNVKMLFSHDQGCPKYTKNPSKIDVKSHVRKSMQKT